MKFILTSILIFCGLLTGFSQDLKKVTKKNKSGLVIEEYYVLKKEKDVKHGDFKKMNNSGDVVEKGFYKNNSMDSLWVFFANNGNDTLSTGSYANNKRVGEWVINDSKGVFSYIYNYTTNEVSNYNWGNETNMFRVLRNGKWVEDEIDSPPLVIDDENPLQIISRNLRYPTKAWRSGISGQVDVAFTVDSTGRMGGISVKKGVNPELDKEAKRAVSVLDITWYPAKKDAKPLTVEYYLPVKFILRK